MTRPCENRENEGNLPQSDARESFYRRTLADILAFSTRLTRNTDLKSLYRESNALARKILQLDFSTLMIVSDDHSSLIIRDAIGFPEDMINTFFLLKGQGLSTYVVKKKKAAVVDDFHAETRFEVPAVVFEHGITSALSVPMMIGDDVFGVMIGHTVKKRRFTPEEIDLYQSIANQSAVAIKNVMHFESLQDSEKRFRTLIDRAGDAVFVSDMNGRLVDVNETACKSLGYSREELLRLTVFDVDPEAGIMEHPEKLWANLSGQQHITLNTRHCRKDGSLFPVEIRVGILPLHDRNYILGFARDISERQQAEREKEELIKQLNHSQKMESVGTLAGGIAHDFNNLLTPIFGYLQLAMLSASDDPELEEYLREVWKAAKRSRELVKQILTFSRRGDEEAYPFEVHNVVKEALQLIRASIPRTIEIRERIGKNCGFVLADPTHIHQIMMNLCTNAYHAMREEGGVLSIALSSLEIPAQGHTGKKNLPSGLYVKLEVGDTGRGIAPEVQERIFEPYFTTKGIGEGTGMGLSVVHGIVTGIGGHIDVHSEPGSGSTFQVYLPAISNDFPVSDEVSEEGIPRGNETIMLVDDEESVIKVEKAILTSLGYVVHAFHSPVEALRHFADQPERFDLLITDMTMPEMTGDKLSSEVMSLCPETPVILCTGYSDLVNEAEIEALGIRGYVTKPILIHSFGRTVRTILDRK